MKLFTKEEGSTAGVPVMEGAPLTSGGCMPEWLGVAWAPEDEATFARDVPGAALSGRLKSSRRNKNV